MDRKEVPNVLRPNPVKQKPRPVTRVGDFSEPYLLVSSLSSSPWLRVVAETSVSTYRKDSSSVNVP